MTQPRRLDSLDAARQWSAAYLRPLVSVRALLHADGGELGQRITNLQFSAFLIATVAVPYPDVWESAKLLLCAIDESVGQATVYCEEIVRACPSATALILDWAFTLENEIADPVRRNKP